MQRQNKRMFGHDYTRVGFYMITLVTAGRRPLFGSCSDNRVHLSPAGEVVQRRWEEIPEHRPAIETNTLVVMPDHLHGIVYVKQPLPKPVGLTIRGYKSGVTSELRKRLSDPHPGSLGRGLQRPHRHVLRQVAVRAPLHPRQSPALLSAQGAS